MKKKIKFSEKLEEWGDKFDDVNLREDLLEIIYNTQDLGMICKKVNAIIPFEFLEDAFFNMFPKEEENQDFYLEYNSCKDKRKFILDEFGGDTSNWWFCCEYSSKTIEIEKIQEEIEEFAFKETLLYLFFKSKLGFKKQFFRE